MTTFTLYTSDSFQNPHCTVYPHAAQIASADDLAAACCRDHVGAKFRNSRRKKQNFLKADVLLMDFDNDGATDPAAWITPEAVQKRLPGVDFYTVDSRNNMKQKGSEGPRPRFHFYAAIAGTEDLKAYEDMKRRFLQLFPEADHAAADGTRFIYGVEQPAVHHFQGQKLLTDVLPLQDPARGGSSARHHGPADFDDSDDDSAADQEAPAGGSGSGHGIIEAGGRHDTLLKYCDAILTRYGDTEEARALCWKRYDDCEQPAGNELTGDDFRRILKDARKHYAQKIQREPGYIPPAEYQKKLKQQAEELLPRHFTDVDQAAVFMKVYGARVCFCPGTGWLYYDGTRWAPDSEIKIQGLVQKLTGKQLKATRAEILRLTDGITAMLEENGGEITDEYKDMQKQLQDAQKALKAVLQFRNTNKVQHTMAEAKPAALIDITELDSKPFLLNTPAGTVDLMTGQLRPHSPDDFLTKSTATGPGTDGAQEWADFLKKITSGDSDMQHYLQLCAGMACIGAVYQEKLLLATGSGGNGKSTFFNTLLRVMGGYGGTISADVLMMNRNGNSDLPEFAALRGLRFVVASELDDGQRLNAAAVKRLCSTDAIHARELYRSPIEFIPSHTVVLFTNFLPRVGSSDSGTWSRLVVLPFQAQFRGTSDEILNYSDTLYQHCGGAVLQWMIDGAREFIASGFRLTEPPAVRIACEQYKAENDWLQNFLNEVCDVERKYNTSSGALYDWYRRWCDRTGEFTRKAAEFKTAMQAAGFTYHKRQRGIFVYGVRPHDAAYNTPEFDDDIGTG